MHFGLWFIVTTISSAFLHFLWINLSSYILEPLHPEFSEVSFPILQNCVTCISYVCGVFAAYTQSLLFSQFCCAKFAIATEKVLWHNTYFSNPTSDVNIFTAFSINLYERWSITIGGSARFRSRLLISSNNVNLIFQSLCVIYETHKDVILHLHRLHRQEIALQILHTTPPFNHFLQLQAVSAMMFPIIP